MDFNPNLFTATSRGTKALNEDVHFLWRSPSGQVTVGGVFDGHSGIGGQVAATVAAECALKYFQDSADDVLLTHTRAQWEVTGDIIFDLMHEAIRTEFIKADAQRRIDAKGVVRNSNGEPVRGGTTATIVVTLAQLDGSTNVICLNAGDSAALLVQADNKHIMLTKLHKPESFLEYKRIDDLPIEDFPVKFRLVYDLQVTSNKDLCPSIFVRDHEQAPVTRQAPTLPGLYAGNVRREPSTYAITPGAIGEDCACIAMTRAIGDFYAVPFGMTHKPSVQSFHVSKEEASAGVHVCLASDGVWDSWFYEAFAARLNVLTQDPNSLGTFAAGQQLFNQTLINARENFGTKHLDDATLVIWKL